MRVVPTMHIVTPKITMNQASHFFLTRPSFPLVALRVTPLPHGIHQVHPAGNGEHDQRAEERSVESNDDLHLGHEDGDGDGGEQHARGGATVKPPPDAYASRSENLWNSLSEQKSEWRLVRTAK